jgi:hypothetical protein
VISIQWTLLRFEPNTVQYFGISPKCAVASATAGGHRHELFISSVCYLYAYALRVTLASTHFNDNPSVLDPVTAILWFLWWCCNTVNFRGLLDERRLCTAVQSLSWTSTSVPFYGHCYVCVGGVGCCLFLVSFRFLMLHCGAIWIG